MLNSKNIKALKSGLINEIPLTDGYKLTVNEFQQIILSRGGKKRYYLSDKLIYRLASKKCSTIDLPTLLEIVNEIKSVCSRLKKESPTRTKLENIITQLYEFGVND